MDSLRLILLLIGAVVIVAVYLHSRLKKGSGEQSSSTGPATPSLNTTSQSITSHSHDDRERGVIEDPSVYSFGHESESTNNNVDDAFEEQDALDDELIEIGHQIKIDGNEETQGYSFQGDSINTEGTSLDSHKESDLEEHRDAELVERVMVIYLLAQPGMKITGSEIKRIAESESLQFGEDCYFHRYSNIDSSTESIFGIANILEPGLFDLSDSENFSTSGLVFFQRLSNAGGALEAFDEMLKTAIEFKEQLDGQLQDSGRNPLNRSAMIKLREQVAAFSLRNPVTPF